MTLAAAPRRAVALCLLMCFALLSACGGDSRTRPDTPAYYTVRAGDTLYSIAWRHGLDYREVARWNGIGRDYGIAVGQRLRLTPPPGGRAAAAKPPATSRPPAASRAPEPPISPPPAWAWPVRKGKVAGPVRQPSGGVGLRIDGESGMPVLAAADGRVVYTGAGLRAYGQLVIVKHGASWLSAYGHNERVLVKEGDEVKAGQVIANMGLGPGQQPMLYFEIRANGRPVDPLTQLPKR